MPFNIYIRKLVIKVIMDFRTPSADKIRARTGFKQYDVILTKDQSVATKIVSILEEEDMKKQYYFLIYRNDLNFHDYKLAMESDENGHIDKNIDCKIKKQKVQ